MRHQHGGKLALLTRDGEDSFAGQSYSRWICPICKAITLVPLSEPN